MLPRYGVLKGLQTTKPRVNTIQEKRKNIPVKIQLLLIKLKRILMLSPTKHGSIHDKKMTDKNLIPNAIPEDVSIVIDTGFQGIQKLHPNVLIPKKKPRGGYLTKAEKEMNCLISSIRITVEHAIGGIKKYGCMADIYRNKNGIDDTFANVTAGLWNLHIEMG